MISSWRFRVVVCTLLFVFFIVATAPATLLSAALHRALPALQMTEPTGTLWRGKSHQSILRVSGGVLALGELSWSINPLSLLLLQPSVRLETKAPHQQVALELSVSLEREIAVTHLIGRFPIATLAPWVPMLVEGDVDFLIEEFSVMLDEKGQATPNALSGVINIQEMVWLGGDRPMPLGDYQADLSLQDDGVLMALNDFEAALAIDGKIFVAFNGRYQLDSTLTARDHLAQEVTNALVWVGKKNAKGDFIVKRNGTF